MKLATRTSILATIATLMIAAPPGPLSADDGSSRKFTVNSTDDPEFVDLSRCTLASQVCSLREALAAADQTPKHDVVLFDVNDTIHLTRQLTVEEPVTIDGRGDATVRVHQGYTVTTLPDRFGNKDPIDVLQPTYLGGANAPMLELHGDGSIVTGLMLDGSITPDPSDLGVERIDRDGDNITDFFLSTIDTDGDGTGDRWLIAGGVHAIFSDGQFPPQLPPGSVEIRRNELRNFNANAIDLFNSQNALIKENAISGGAVGQQGASADGISMSIAADATVTDNSVRGFRNGFATSQTTGMTLKGNTLEQNRTGIEVESADSQGAVNVIKKNRLANNGFVGIVLVGVADSRVEENIVAFNGVFGIQILAASQGNEIDKNEVSGNGFIGIDINSSNDNSVTENTLTDNGADPTSTGAVLVRNGSHGNLVDKNTVSNNGGFAIVVGGSSDNVVSDNEVQDNAGSGIVVADGAQGNQIEYNDVLGNDRFGVFTGRTQPAPFASGNVFQGNTSLGNAITDMFDNDPVCNDTWNSNTFVTVFSVSENCIE